MFYCAVHTYYIGDMDVLFILLRMYFVIDLLTYPDTYLEVSTAMKRGYIYMFCVSF